MKNCIVAILFVAGIFSTAFGASPSPRVSENKKPHSTVSLPHEEVSSQPDSFDASLGLAIPLTGDITDAAEAGVSMDGRWIHSVSPQLGYGVGIDYKSFGKKTLDEIDTQVTMLSIQGLVRHNLPKSGEVRPYILGGVGITHTQLNITIPESVEGVPVLSFGGSVDDTSPSFLLESGVDIPLQKGLLLALSARYEQFLFKIGDIDGGGVLTFLAGLRW